MVWNRFQVFPLLACLCGCLTAPTHAADVCPVIANTLLRYAVVFDGPPKQMASLIPDKARRRSGYWQLGYVYDAGRSVWIQCQYFDGTKFDEHLANRINRCDYALDAAKTLTMKCQ